MATEVKVPALGESISSGILATWHIASGDYVNSGQAIYDLETDKITSEGTAEVSGVIELKVEEGDEVEIGAVIAVIDESAAAPAGGETAETAAAESTEEVKAVPEKLAPSVQRLAAETGIDPKTVDGSGKGGRVTKGDMLAAKEAAPKKVETPAAAPVPSSASTHVLSGEKVSRKKMTPLRKTIARRLVEAQQSTAMLTTFNEVDMSAVMKLRKAHQEAFVDQHGIKLGFMSFFTKAVVQALKVVPNVNARIEGDEIIQHHYYDIGIAVSTPKGLMVPVVRDCDEKSFALIEKDIIHYAGKARDGKIGIDDLQGGVFSITNGGIFGSMLSTPILNAPQSAILGMHTIQERPMAVNGQVEIRPMMYLALSYDHRLVDGREAVTFLVNVKKSIEDPSRLLFDI